MKNEVESVIKDVFRISKKDPVPNCERLTINYYDDEDVDDGKLIEKDFPLPWGLASEREEMLKNMPTVPQFISDFVSTKGYDINLFNLDFSIALNDEQYLRFSIPVPIVIRICIKKPGWKELAEKYDM